MNKISNWDSPNVGFFIEKKNRINSELESDENQFGIEYSSLLLMNNWQAAFLKNKTWKNLKQCMTSMTRLNMSWKCNNLGNKISRPYKIKTITSQVSVFLLLSTWNRMFNETQLLSICASSITVHPYEMLTTNKCLTLDC